jgi:hypothetical protein
MRIYCIPGGEHRLFYRSTGQRWAEIKESIDLMHFHIKGNFYSDLFYPDQQILLVWIKNYRRCMVHTLKFYAECSHIHCKETKLQH